MRSVGQKSTADNKIMREFLKTKRAETVYAIALVVGLQIVALLPMGKSVRLPTLVALSVAGLGGYFLLYKERYRGRWTKVALAFAIGGGLGIAISAIRRLHWY